MTSPLRHRRLLLLAAVLLFALGLLVLAPLFRRAASVDQAAPPPLTTAATSDAAAAAKANIPAATESPARQPQPQPPTVRSASAQPRTANPARKHFRLISATPTETRFVFELGDLQATTITRPDGDFALNQAVRFPRLTDIETMPVGPPGTRWGDLRVADGAAIAAALGERWAAFRLDRIVPLRRSDSERRPDYVYELYTHGGSRVIWGRAPGAKSPGEPSVAEKLRFLDSWVKRHGTLEGARGPQEIDVPYLLKRGRTAGRAAPARR